MQSLMCEKQHNSMRRVFATMVREEGVLRPLRGLNAMALGAGPAHAMYFTALEKIREQLTARAHVPVHLASGMAAVMATVLHDAIMTPAEGEFAPFGQRTVESIHTIRIRRRTVFLLSQCSCEAANADVLQSLLFLLPGHLLHLPERRSQSVLPFILHSAHNERALSGNMVTCTHTYIALYYIHEPHPSVFSVVLIPLSLP